MTGVRILAPRLRRGRLLGMTLARITIGVYLGYAWAAIKVIIQVFPIGIHLFNKIELPLALPPFYLFFSGYGTVNIRELLVINKMMNIIFFRKTRDQVFFVLIYSFD